LHESFLDSHVPGKTRTRVEWELRSESLHESFLDSHVPVKREQELHESWEARVCMRVFWTLMSRSNKNKSCMRVDWIQSLSETKMRVEKWEFAWEFDESTRELAVKRVYERLNSELQLSLTVILVESWLDITAHSENSHERSSKFEPAQS
jgi:hypothetical protein